MVRTAEAGWELAVIEPQREPQPTKRKTQSCQKLLLALPKGLVDPGEKPEQTAIREVAEETGLTASLITKLGDIKYVYSRTWSDQQRVFKIVSFYLLHYESGSIGQISDDMRIEVKSALWIPLAGAERKLAYKGEQGMAQKAQEYLKKRPDPLQP